MLGLQAGDLLNLGKFGFCVLILLELQNTKLQILEVRILKRLRGVFAEERKSEGMWKRGDEGWRAKVWGWGEAGRLGRRWVLRETWQRIARP